MFEQIGNILKRHSPLHNVIISDDKGYCLECDSESRVEKAYADHPVHGQTEYRVCSTCGVDVERDEEVVYCKLHGILK